MATNPQPSQIPGADPNAPSNPAPTSQGPPADANLGVLAHIAIHALAGAVRGMQAQQSPQSTSDDAAASGAADEPSTRVPVDTTTSATPNPRGQSQPVDRRTLAMAQIQHHALQNLKLAHAISQAEKTDPSQLPILQAQAKSAQVPVRSRARALGLKKIASGVTSYQEANEMGLPRKLAHGQVIPFANPDGSVDIYEMGPDAYITPTPQALEIRKPTGSRADGRVRWETVGVLPAGAMTQAAAVTQIVLPEQRAAAELISTAMTVRRSIRR